LEIVEKNTTDAEPSQGRLHLEFPQ
jgi:hypothetical protein